MSIDSSSLHEEVDLRVAEENRLYFYFDIDNFLKNDVNKRSGSFELSL